MSTQTVENILHAAENLSFSEQLTRIQRLLDGLRKTPKPLVHRGNLSVQLIYQSIS